MDLLMKLLPEAPAASRLHTGDVALSRSEHESEVFVR
jgi:hypothetical protein